MSHPVRIGIIGCGDVMTAYMAHALLLRGEGLAEVTWACDRRPEREEFMRQRYGVRRFTHEPEELLASEDVDLALVLTSMESHAPLALRALRSGKHVLVEKPIGVNLEEAAELLEAANTGPGWLLCAPFVMLSPTYRAIWQRVRRGEIGKLLTARARYGHAGPTWGPWYYQHGGAIFDLAPYNLTSLTGLLGPVRRVAAMTGVAIPERVLEGRTVPVTVEDNAHLLLDFGESCLAVVTAAFTMQQYRTPALELYGAQGVVQMLGDDWDPEGYEMWLNSAGAWLVYKESDPGWLWTAGLRHMVECIRAGVAPLLNPAQAYHVLEVMLKAREAGRTGKAQEIESVFPVPDLPLEAEGDIAAHLVHDRTHQREKS
jgi:predicted dehydrogenase